MSDGILDLMLKAALAGAAEITAIYLGDIAVQQKPDGSPVTLADQRAERAILDILAPSGLPALAEESVAGGDVPTLGERFFCIDPLDGTKEFVKRNGEFTVNIALIENGRATHGVIVAPASGATFVGGPEGAFEIDYRGERTRMHTNGHHPLKVVASRSHAQAGLKRFCDALLVVDDVSVGSSLKFCLLARGDAQLYPRFSPTSEWDTAAGQAILEAAGGAVVTLDGAPLTYGRGGDHLNPNFMAAASPELAAQGAAEMRRVLDLD